MAKNKKSAPTLMVPSRIPVLKTYKMFVGGEFPRTESGRFYTPRVKGRSLGNFCQGSRKDVRQAVAAARSAQAQWANRTSYNRAQILYRIAELLEARRLQFIQDLNHQGSSERQAQAEVDMSIERLVYYAGWCDKYQQVFGSVNPVASEHFNVSILEPMGVVFHIAPDNQPLLGVISIMAPIIASGNTTICLASESKPISAVNLAEVLATADVPPGVVNILTGSLDELAVPAADHFDINAIAWNRSNGRRNKTTLQMIEEKATSNLKRVRRYERPWTRLESQNPYLIADFCEVKTTWHPIETISESGSGY